MYPIVPRATPGNVMVAARLRQIPWQDHFCQAKVEDFYASVNGDEQVVRFEIAMDNTLFVSCRESARDLHPKIDRLSKCNRVTADHLRQRLALQQFRDEVGHAEKRAHLIYGQDVGVIQCCGRLGLLLEIGAGVRDLVKPIREGP